MKREIWQNEQPILTEDLNYAQSSKEDAIRERYRDILTPGVVLNSQQLGETDPFKITVGSGSIYFDIGTGVAVSPTGERIIVDSYINYNIDNITHQSDDGLGGFKTTPRSTGSRNILLGALILPSFTYYIWIGYLSTIDDSVFAIRFESTEKLYTKATDGYEVRITTNSTNPDNTRFVLLGTILTSADSKIASISTDLRNKSEIAAKGVSFLVPTSPVDRPLSYSSGQSKTVDDHIKSIGSGVVTNKNPHAITAEDLGIFDITGISHQSKLHSSGIFTRIQDSIVSALYPEVIVESGTNQDRINFKPLVSDEEAVVNGVSILPSDFPADTTFYFIDGNGNPIAAGYYLFVLDSISKTIIRYGPYPNLTNVMIDVNSAVDTLPLIYTKWDVNIDNPSNYNLILHETKDLRKFGNISIFNLQANLLGGLESGGGIGNRIKKLYNSKLIGTTYSYSYNVNGKTLIVSVDGAANSTITFSGTDPLTVYVIASQINSASIGLLAEIYYDSNGPHLKLLATTSINIVGGTACTILGFTPGQNDSGFLREVKTNGDIPGVSEFTYSGDKITQIKTIYGNVTVIQDLVYVGDNLKSVTETVQ
jgi:hypothetical protein